MISLSICAAYVLICFIWKINDVSTLLGVIWSALILFYMSVEDEFVDITLIGDIIISTWFLLFVVGYRCCVFRYQVKANFRWINANLYFPIVAFVGVLAVVNVLYQSASVSELMELRDRLNSDVYNERAQIGLGLIMPILMSSLIVSRERKNFYWIVFLCLGGVISVASTSKIFLIMFIISAIPNGIVLNKVDFKIWSWLFFIACGSFIGLHFVLDKYLVIEDSILLSVYATFKTYIASGLAGFFLYTKHEVHFPEKAIFFDVARYFPVFGDVPKTNILEWSPVGDWNTNVYTAFPYWIEGIGVTGFLVISFILGAFSRFVFNQSLIELLVIKRFLLLCLLMIFFQDFFVASFSMWVGYAVSTAISLSLYYGIKKHE